MRFPLTIELWQRLTRHPDWRYELIDGEAVLSHRPRPLLSRRPTALAVPHTFAEAEVRELDPVADRAATAALLVETWVGEDPYRSLAAPEQLLRQEVRQGLDTAEFGAVAVRAGAHAVCAVALVHRQASGSPTLSWLTVVREARERGSATEMLAVITRRLRDRGVRELASGASAANIPSLRWHLSRGFELTPDPLRDILRAAPPTRSARDGTDRG